MSAQLKEVPRIEVKRLRVTARFDHETVKFEGNIFDFIQMIIDGGWEGRGTFNARKGAVFGLEFDMRDKKPLDSPTT